MGKTLNGKDFDGKVIKSDKPVLVDFFAPWCGPCKMMGPIIDELAEEIKDKAEVYKVNVDEEGELANRFQVMSIPTILVFKDGEISEQFVGVSQKEQLKKALLS